MAAELLRDAQCRAARPRDKVYRLRDGAGLSLQVMPAAQGGGKYWTFRYRFMRMQRMMNLGVYPTMGLKEARAELVKHKMIVEAGGDPVQTRKLAKLKQTGDALQTFGSVSREWLDRNKGEWSRRHGARYDYLLTRALLPTLGKLPISKIDVTVLLAALRSIEGKSNVNARKARTAASMIFDYAIASGRALENPAKLTLGALKPRSEVQHRKALTMDQLGPTLRALEESRIRPVTQAALLMLLYTGLRDFSLRAARWQEIDFKNATMTVPAERMKGRKGKKKPHVVPLPTQALRVLRELQPLTDRGPESFVFPSQSSAKKPMAEKTLCTALRVVSGIEDVTAHGCRSLITDALYNAGFRTEAIEVQMSHDIGTLAREHNEPVKSADAQVRASYLRSGFLELRARMMQWWGDSMDALRIGKALPRVRTYNVVRIKGARTA